MYLACFLILTTDGYIRYMDTTSNGDTMTESKHFDARPTEEFLNLDSETKLDMLYKVIIDIVSQLLSCCLLHCLYNIGFMFMYRLDATTCFWNVYLW